ncbi:MAG: hypothetical protein ACP5QK_13390, partial [Myxococcota bacterium]
MEDGGANGYDGGVADGGGQGDDGGAGEDGGAADGNVEQCPPTPSNTIIVPVNGVDDDAIIKRSFDEVFDNPGSTHDSMVPAGWIKALEFTNNSYKAGIISGTQGNLGGNYKDWSISICPGDFRSILPAACLKTAYMDVNIYYSTDGSQGCVIPINSTVYLNIRPTYSDQFAGFVLNN